MNEITRIHLAKVAYDVDIAAKKQLEKYIKELEEFTGSGEVLNDIEIRMTELLAERHVKAGGVITKDDVEAIRKQLGEPYEFAEEDGDIAVGPVDESHHHPRRFFRDTHNAVLGGVLSGIALYAKVDVLWVRLGFALILFGSFGFAFLGYVLAWIIVPPAKTATDRLRQAGRPVTASSIRSLKNNPEAMTVSTIAPTVQRVISITVGVLCYIGAFTLVTLALVSLVAVLNGGQEFITGYVLPHSMNSYSWLFVGIATLGLLLLIALLCLIAQSFISQKLTKRMVVSGIVVVGLGLACSVALAGTATVAQWQMRTEVQQLMKPKDAVLPADFSHVTSAVFSLETSKGGPSGTPVIHYIVQPDSTPNYTLIALPGAKLRVSIEGTVATVSLAVPNDSRNSYAQSELTIYGPALKDITAHAIGVTYQAASQALPLTVTADSDATASVEGTASSVKVMGSGMVDLSSASIVDLIVVSNNGLNVTAGTVRTLDVTLPEVCPANGSAAARVSVSGVTAGKFIYNGNKRNATTYQTDCAQVSINGNQSDY